jgi:hypothetical protein
VFHQHLVQLVGQGVLVTLVLLGDFRTDAKNVLARIEIPHVEHDENVPAGTRQCGREDARIEPRHLFSGREEYVSDFAWCKRVRVAHRTRLGRFHQGERIPVKPLRVDGPLEHPTPETKDFAYRS